MTSKTLKERWTAAEQLIGFFLRFSTPEVVEVLSKSGADFFVFDLEHGTFGRESLSRCLLTALAAGIPPIVRLADTRASEIQFVIGAGACGIIVPHAADAVEVAAVVKFARTSALERGFAGANRISSLRQTDWRTFKRRMDDLLVIAQLDEPEGISAVDEIISTPGLDAVFLGRIGLSLAMNSVQSRVDDDLIAVCAACRERGIQIGLSITNSQDAARWSASGVNLLCVDSDQLLLLNSARRRLDEFRASTIRG